VSAAPIVPGLVRPTQKSKRQAEMVLGTVNAVETRRKKDARKSRTECVNGSPALCSLTESFSY
jgi:hypothetical protein